MKNINGLINLSKFSNPCLNNSVTMFSHINNAIDNSVLSAVSKNIIDLQGTCSILNSSSNMSNALAPVAIASATKNVMNFSSHVNGALITSNPTWATKSLATELQDAFSILNNSKTSNAFAPLSITSATKNVVDFYSHVNGALITSNLPWATKSLATELQDAFSILNNSKTSNAFAPLSITSATKNVMDFYNHVNGALITSNLPWATKSLATELQDAFSILNNSKTSNAFAPLSITSATKNVMDFYNHANGALITSNPPWATKSLATELQGVLSIFDNRKVYEGFVTLELSGATKNVVAFSNNINPVIANSTLSFAIENVTELHHGFSILNNHKIINAFVSTEFSAPKIGAIFNNRDYKAINVSQGITINNSGRHQIKGSLQSIKTMLSNLDSDSESNLLAWECTSTDKNLIMNVYITINGNVTGNRNHFGDIYYKS